MYAQTIIKIVPKRAAEVKSDTLAGKKSKSEEASIKPVEILPQLQRVTKEFNVEVRPYAVLQQQDFIAQLPFNDKGGMLISFDPPELATLNSANFLAKVDVLYVLPDGVIAKIAPNLSLRKLDEPIASDKPVRAWIFLKAGTAQLSDIQPGDSVEGAMFKTHPVVLE